MTRVVHTAVGPVWAAEQSRHVEPSALRWSAGTQRGRDGGTAPRPGRGRDEGAVLGSTLRPAQPSASNALSTAALEGVSFRAQVLTLVHRQKSRSLMAAQPRRLPTRKRFRGVIASVLRRSSITTDSRTRQKS